jgi:release factor glutamine methyltransferase
VDDLVARLRRAGCVYAEEEAALLVEAAGSAAELERLTREREAGTPLEQVLGWAAFAGLRVPVAPGVFVPRARTQLLAREALAVTADGSLVVELCCGAGAISLVLLAARSGLELHAADLEPAAVACAAANLGGRGTVHGGDLYDALPTGLAGRVDVLVANAPYVPTAAIALMPHEARDHEPPVALDGGPDGLDVLRRVVAAAPAWLAPGGHLLFECGERQLPTALGVVEATGLTGRGVQDEELDATVVVAGR